MSLILVKAFAFYYTPARATPHKQRACFCFTLLYVVMIVVGCFICNAFPLLRQARTHTAHAQLLHTHAGSDVSICSSFYHHLLFRYSG